jgi:hypothetical protein
MNLQRMIVLSYNVADLVDRDHPNEETLIANLQTEVAVVATTLSAEFLPAQVVMTVDRTSTGRHVSLLLTPRAALELRDAYNASALAPRCARRLRDDLGRSLIALAMKARS